MNLQKKIKEFVLETSNWLRYIKAPVEIFKVSYKCSTDVSMWIPLGHYDLESEYIDKYYTEYMPPDTILVDEFILKDVIL